MNRLHPLSAVAIALNSAFVGVSIALALVGALTVAFEFASLSWMAVVGPLGLLLGGAYGVAYYLRFEYGITPDTFDVSSGVFSRRSREIPYRRIQNVDVRQGVFQRVLGLAVVSIETAGGGDTEAALNFVSKVEASRLQREIRRRTTAAKDRDRTTRTNDVGAGSSVTDERTHVDLPGNRTRAEDGSDEPSATTRAGPEAGVDHGRKVAEDRRGKFGGGRDGEFEDGNDGGLEGGDNGFGRGTESGTESEGRFGVDPTPSAMERAKPLFHLRARELLLYSFTSLRPAAVAAVLFVVFLATDAIIAYLVAVSQPFGGPETLGAGTTTDYGILTIVSAIHGIAVTYFVSVAYTLATYYDFHLGRVSDDFVYERGLLQKYSGSIPAEKVQSITVTDNPAQRLIGYAGMWIETAGYGPESNSGSQSAVPLARKTRVYTFTERLTGVETPRFERPPALARRRYLVRYSLIAGAIVGLAYAITAVTSLEGWYLAAVVFIAVPPAAHLRYVHLGYFVGEDHLLIRRGFWRRRTTVIPYYRIQTVNTRRSIFQRRLGLASLVVDTASSRSFFWATPTIYDLELADARAVHRTSRKRLQTALRERADSDDVGLSVDFT